MRTTTSRAVSWAGGAPGVAGCPAATAEQAHTHAPNTRASRDRLGTVDMARLCHAVGLHGPVVVWFAGTWAGDPPPMCR